MAIKFGGDFEVQRSPEEVKLGLPKGAYCHPRKIERPSPVKRDYR